VVCDLPGISHFFPFENVVAKLFYEDSLRQVSLDEQINDATLHVTNNSTSDQMALFVVLAIVMGIISGLSWCAYFAWVKATNDQLTRRASGMYELVSQADVVSYEHDAGQQTETAEGDLDVQSIANRSRRIVE